MKGFHLNPGDYRFEGDPVRALDEQPATSDDNYMQHVFSKVQNAHVIRRDSKGVVRCSWRNCILNKGRVWRKKKKVQDNERGK